MLRIAIIGSTRPGRKGEAVAKLVYEVAQKRTDAEFELVDIKDFDLPLLDEPVSPIMGQYNKPPNIPMIWQGLTDAQICRSLKNPKENKNRNVPQLVEHLAKDELVLWGWNPFVRTLGTIRAS